MPLPLHGLLFPISNKGSFICTIPYTQDGTYQTIPVVEHWLEREIAQWVHHEEGKIAHTRLCYTSCGALAGMRNSSMGPP